MSERPAEAIERILDEIEDADDVLRGAVAALVADPGIVWAGVAFLDDGELTLGPSAGAPDEARRERVPIAFQGAPVGELWADGSPDRALLEHVASRIARRCSSAGTRAAKPGSRRTMNSSNRDDVRAA